eukprot:TRINITY_DN6883_c0_g1_i4.p2 TRINITY_DN6883_c0_g1~~TRINITY_DN6883_c0_g1_i4.p2  ORF type:complete len:106 (+),score=2.62 TRINITY_DN6883_c0_g1_i4:588-905(+)
MAWILSFTVLCAFSRTAPNKDKVIAGIKFAHAREKTQIHKRSSGNCCNTLTLALFDSIVTISTTAKIARGHNQGTCVAASCSIRNVYLFEARINKLVSHLQPETQ